MNSIGFSRSPVPPRNRAAVVIGAGVGGLVAALELAGAGLDVTLCDKASAPGGKLRTLDIGGCRIDVGPTVFTLRSVFDDIFSRAGTSLDACLTLRRLDILARHAWSADERLDLFADLDRSVDAVGRFAGAGEAERYRAFCRRAKKIHRTLDQSFMRAASPSMARLVASVGLGRDLFDIAPFTSLWRALGDHFHDPRLRQLFARYATYCGSSPFLAPATLMLIAHVEQKGVWTVEGGMSRLAAELARLVRERGATIRLDTAVQRILVEGGRAAGVELSTGERLAADAVVCNADVAALGGGLFGAPARGAVPRQKPARRSLSALTFALDTQTSGFPLARHNVFFSADYRAEFDDLSAGRLPREPTVYVCAQDRDGDGPPGGPPERLFCIVNAPSTGDTHAFDEPETAPCIERSYRLFQKCGLTIHAEADALRVTTPNDFERLFPATGGALYGAASHGAMASFRRPGVRSRLPGLYLCGGSVHPGPGLPMAALSGRMAAATLLADSVSMRRWRAAAMPGGTSTA